MLLLLLGHEHGGELLLLGGHLPLGIGSYHSTLGSLSVDFSSSLGRVSWRESSWQSLLLPLCGDGHAGLLAEGDGHLGHCHGGGLLGV